MATSRMHQQRNTSVEEKNILQETRGVVPVESIQCGHERKEGTGVESWWWGMMEGTGYRDEARMEFLSASQQELIGYRSPM